ncbi:fasciclin domain containing protein [Nitzschia inconspicua]|uniref:Fasciclin domain containing protein n=1 Tax=Nitzschia inconspicua TaxID=303405 RepID=A0A9K3L901_9STRA|nr:fasciclin domain containing protein [Nitzschia inconspicua]
MKLTLPVICAVGAVSVGAQTVVDVAVSLPETFSTLVDLVTTAELADALATTEDITVFAPTNEAFGQLDSAIVNNLMTEEWKLHLQDTLLYHVVPSVVPASAIVEEITATTLNDENITASPSGEGVVINESSNVIQADVEADNGLIHVIDQVLLPSWVSNSIVDRATDASALSTLVELVVQAQLVDTLSGAGPFTVFAPSDDAFSETINALTSENGVELPLDNDLVTTLLTYHVVEGIYPASAIEDGLELVTVQGETITFGLSDGGATVNGEGIVITDILANNGIVHVIDGVLIPEAASSMLEAEDMENPGNMEDGAPTTAPNAAGYAASNTVAFAISAAVALFGM